MSRPELANVNAVKNGHVYVVDEALLGVAGTLMGAAYALQVMHPDLAADIDSTAIHQEYVDRFSYIDFDVSENGVFVYPPLEVEDS